MHCGLRQMFHRYTGLIAQLVEYPPRTLLNSERNTDVRVQAHLTENSDISYRTYDYLGSYGVLWVHMHGLKQKLCAKKEVSYLTVSRCLCRLIAYRKSYQK